MDTTKFDALTKACINEPRRRVLGGMVAGALSTLFGLGVRDVAAQPCRRSSDCATGQVCRNRTCVFTCGDPSTCSTGFFICQNDADCFCAKAPRKGGGLCLEGNIPCNTLQGCTRQRQCPPGLVCGTCGCGANVPKFVCQPPCGGAIAGAAGPADDLTSSIGSARRSGEPMR